MADHKEHRQRVKKRFLGEGLDHFSELHALELLLFYGKPREDTNELAHALLDRFGNLHQVLTAPPEQLMQIKGVGEHVAILLSLVKGISQKYLESIMTVLSKAGFVDAVHGKGGGYRLNRSPEGYTIGSILKLTEGSLAAVSCTSQGPAACSRTTCCQTKPMWDKLDAMIDSFFEGITLADLMEDSLNAKKCEEN